jgi:hypothetical protein
MFRSMISACAVFAITLLLGSEPALVAQAAAVTATQACDARDPQPDMLLQLLTPARREKFAEASLQVATAELDGAAPAEAIVFADYAPHPSDWPGAPDDGTPAPPLPVRESVFWVFGCKAQGWELLAEKGYRLDDAQYDDSETQGAAGLKVVKAERLLPDRDLLRVEWVDLRDGHSPFYTFRSFDLYALQSNRLSRVLRCPTLYEYRSGPERSGRETTRTIQFLKDKLPARIRVTLSSDWDPGVEPEDPDKFPDWEKPRDGEPASESRIAIYRYDGTRFVTEQPACDEGLGETEDR